ncbi:MAG: type II secretion system F family protein [Pseudomonadota bacterium]
MPLFQYKAVTINGETQEGVLDAATHSAIMAHIKSLGLIPIRATEVGLGGADSGASIAAPTLKRSRFTSRGISQDDLAITTRELATLLRAGLPLDRSLEILINLGENERLRELLQTIRNEVRGGAALSKALDQHRDVFTRFYINMVKAGEAGGALGGVLMRLADYMERAKELRETVVSSLIYPVILLIVATLSISVLLMFVVPQFKQIFDQAGKTLPLITDIVLTVGLFLRSSWPIVIAAVLLVIWLLARSWVNPLSRAGWDRRILTWPVFGPLAARVEMAKFSRSLATLLQNGVPLLAGLSILKDTLGNAVFRGAVEVVSRELKEGRGMAKPMMETGVFPKLAVQMIAVGEETGQLEEMLMQVADVYDREVATAIKRALALLQPVMIIGLAIAIGLIIFAILSPMFDMMDLPF